MQYFLVAAFCWMFVEGIYFYLLVVQVYNIANKMHIYHVMSWGRFLKDLLGEVSVLVQPLYMLVLQVFPLSWSPCVWVLLQEKMDSTVSWMMNSKQPSLSLSLMLPFQFSNSVFRTCDSTYILVTEYFGDMRNFLILFFFTFALSCWMSSNSNLIWIFVAIVVGIEIVSKTRC